MRIFVGNLSFKASDSDLQDLFSQFGQVKTAKVLTDKMSGRSRGFGFVEMDDQSEAEAAISKLNGSNFMDRAITVNEARANPNGDRSSGSQRRY